MEKSKSDLPSIIAFGEVLWDMYATHRSLGGAPYNVLGHLRQLSHAVQMISRIGSDKDGEDILDIIRQSNVGHQHVQVDPNFPTGKVQVGLDQQGKPSYEIVSPSAWDFIETTELSIMAVQAADVFLCGTLAARNEVSRQSLFDCLEAAHFKVVDLNLRLDYYSKRLIHALLSAADLLKVNDEEFSILANLCDIAPEDLYTYLHDHYRIEVVVQTRGAKGAEASRLGQIEMHPGYTIKVVDTVGSGDAFLAGFLSAFVQQKKLHEALEFGCRLGAYVATKPGAIPPHDGLATLDGLSL